MYLRRSEERTRARSVSMTGTKKRWSLQSGKCQTPEPAAAFTTSMCRWKTSSTTNSLSRRQTSLSWRTERPSRRSTSHDKRSLFGRPWSSGSVIRLGEILTLWKKIMSFWYSLRAYLYFKKFKPTLSNLFCCLTNKSKFSQLKNLLLKYAKEAGNLSLKNFVLKDLNCGHLVEKAFRYCSVIPTKK